MEHILLFILVGTLAGTLGALTGLGGGVIVITALTLLFHVPLHQAMAAGLMASMATSSGAASALLKEGYTNLKIGIFLEVGTIVGALVGAGMVAYMPIHLLQIVLGVTILFSAFFTARSGHEHAPQFISDPWALRLALPGRYPTKAGWQDYGVCHIKSGWSLMVVAGMLSGLLGIGSGVIKVLAMDRVMRLPYKVSTATSNFIIGITAAGGIGIYWAHGYVHSKLCAPIMLGVLCGAWLGAHGLAKFKTQNLRTIFSIIVAGLGIQMIVRGMGY